MSPHLHQNNFDVIIVGGGLVGMAAAKALSKNNFKICLLENQPIEAIAADYDNRTLVVNRASMCFWQHLGIWSLLTNNIASIDKVHVSNKGRFGSVVFKAKELGVDVLASVVEARVLAKILRQDIESDANINVICPAHMSVFSEEGQSIHVTYKDDQNNSHNISASLMLAADGVQSGIRQQLQLEAEIKSYDRTAIVCNITPELAHQQCAYERLTTDGPTALLPFNNNRCGFVWTVSSQQAGEILSLPDDEFIKRAHTQFGYRLGRFLKVGKRNSYPLYLVTVDKQVQSRVILLGNAAHHMSPVSAQGLNLAVRDVAVLVELLQKTKNAQGDIGSGETLEIYQKNTKADQNSTMKYTDDLMGWFAIDHGIVNNMRSAALFAMDQSKALKTALFSRVSGYRSVEIPRLLRLP